MIIDCKFYINGEHIPNDAAMTLVRMLWNDAKQMAGEFHQMNRSVRFRANWPNEYRFAESEWRNFVEGVRIMYSQRLGDPKTSPADAEKMFKAMILEKDVGDLLKAEGFENDNRLQITKGTESFEGSRSVSQQVLDKFGPGRNARAVVADAMQTLH